MSAPAPINTTRDQVIIKTRRGRITIGPHGNLDGIWRVVSLELRNNQQVRKMAGGVTRKTLLAWRRKGFPEPVLKLQGAGYNNTIELWSRTQVEEWLAAR